MRALRGTVNVVTAVAALSLASVGWAQQPEPEPAAKFSSDVEVPLIQIEVRVDDKKTKEFVAGLGVGDFEVFEDGEPVEILFVDEVSPADREETGSTAGETISGGVVRSDADGTRRPAPSREASVVVVIDQANSSPSGIARQRTYVKNFLRGLRGSDVTLGLFVLAPDGAFRLVSRFSKDLSVAIRAVSRLTHGSGGQSDRGHKRRQIESRLDEQLSACTLQQAQGRTLCENLAVDRVIRLSETFAREERQRATNSMKGLERVLAFSDHLPGRRSMVFVSEGIDPGGAAYFQVAGQLIEYYSKTEGLRGAGAYLRDVQRRASSFSFEQPLFQKVIDRALASGVTVHWLNPAHTTGLSPVDVTQHAGSYAFGAPIVNAGDPIRLMQGLAEDTGGLALTKAARVAAFYDRITDDVQRYYVVSYSPARSSHDGAVHDVEVKVKRKRTKVRVRESYTDLGREERLLRGLAAALDFPSAFNEFETKGAVTYVVSPEGGYDLSLRIAVPYAELVPRVNDGTASAQLHLGFVIRDAKGEPLQTANPVVSVSHPFADFTKLAEGGAYFDYRQKFHLKPGRYGLTGAVIDGTSRRAATREAPIYLPEPGAACLTVAPVMLAASTEPLTEAVAGLEFDDGGNALLGSRRLRFASLVNLPSSGRLVGIYQLVNPSTSADGGASVEVFFRLLRGEKFVNQTEPRKLEQTADLDTLAITSQFDVPYSGLPSGEYRLEVVARDLRSGCSSIAGAPFQILARTARATAPGSPGGLR